MGGSYLECSLVEITLRSLNRWERDKAMENEKRKRCNINFGKSGEIIHLIQRKLKSNCEWGWGILHLIGLIYLTLIKQPLFILMKARRKGEINVGKKKNTEGGEESWKMKAVRDREGDKSGKRQGRWRVFFSFFLFLEGRWRVERKRMR